MTEQPRDAWPPQRRRLTVVDGEPTPVWDTGPAIVNVDCPNCAQPADIRVNLAAVLKVTEGAAVSQLGVRLKAAPVDHRCHQTRLEVDLTTGEVTTP